MRTKKVGTLVTSLYVSTLWPGTIWRQHFDDELRGYAKIIGKTNILCHCSDSFVTLCKGCTICMMVRESRKRPLKWTTT